MEINYQETVILMNELLAIKPVSVIEYMVLENLKDKVRLNSEELEQRELVKILRLQPKELSLLKSHWASSEEITDELFLLIKLSNVFKYKPLSFLLLLLSSWDANAPSRISFMIRKLKHLQQGSPR